MKRVWQIGLAVVMWMCVLATFSNAQQPGTARQGSGGGWTIPPTAAGEKNPLTANDATIGDGKKLFTAKCQRCHGASGKGDGADADPAHKTDMDLTAAARAARNPDGVVFYKIWNGRTSPKMPAFSEELNKEQVWSLVTYVQTLRAK
jgi:mono/diheme cytochrome c family protein